MDAWFTRCVGRNNGCYKKEKQWRLWLKRVFDLPETISHNPSGLWYNAYFTFFSLWTLHYPKAFHLHLTQGFNLVHFVDNRVVKSERWAHSSFCLHLEIRSCRLRIEKPLRVLHLDFLHSRLIQLILVIVRNRSRDLETCSTEIQYRGS